ncbi:MAG: hypothetical protein ACQESO_09225 [Bacillota bacterium]
MQQIKAEDCSCPKVDCVRHGNCEVCAEHHLATEKAPFCRRDEVNELAEDG